MNVSTKTCLSLLITGFFSVNGLLSAEELSTPEVEETRGKANAEDSWDITGTFGPVEAVEFTTDQGTWMNLDIHPSGEFLVFDLLGDLYTLPLEGGTATRITQGAAYDFQPRFSPQGDRLLFTSDRGGTFNIWVADFSEGQLGESSVLIEDKKNVVDGAAWDPSGDWVFAQRRTTDTSSIGISELWAYNVDGGKGISLVGRKEFGEVDSISPTQDGRWIYLGGRRPFNYSQNPYGSLWTVQRYDRRLGRVEPVSQGLGSSAVPVMSPDEKSLAFIRRVDGHSTLWLHHLESGAENQLWDGLDRDQIEAFSTHGAYPRFAWTPDGQSLVVWAQGGFHRIKPFGATVEVTPIPFEAEVRTSVHQRLRQARSPIQDEVKARIIRWPVQSPKGDRVVFHALGRLYTQDLESGPATRLTDLDAFELSPAFSPDGQSLVFAAWSDATGGTLYRMKAKGGSPQAIYHSKSQLANPAFSPDGRTLVFVEGSGANLRGKDFTGELRHDLKTIPSGGGKARFVVSTTNRGPNRRITRPVFHASGERIYFFEDLPDTADGARGSRTPPKTGLTSVTAEGLDRRVHLRFRYAQEAIPNPQGTHVAFSELHNAFVAPMPTMGQTVDVEPGSAIPLARLSWDGGEWVAWTDEGRTVTWSFGPEFARTALKDLGFSAEAGERPQEEVDPISLTLTEGGAYRLEEGDLDLETLEVALAEALEADKKPEIQVTAAEKATLGPWQALVAWCGEKKLDCKLSPAEEEDAEEDASTEAEEKEAMASTPEKFNLEVTVPRARPHGILALVGGRIITMDGDSVIDDGTVVIEGDRIVAVGARDQVIIPEGAHVVDCTGKTLIPGLIDTHAHMGYGALDVSPQNEWQYYANLAYGVTTTHDPSASTHLVFGQSEMVEAGIMVGPRIFSTGFILYGAINPDMAPINTYEEALSHVRRLKALGAFSVKSYMQPRRDQRQWLLKAAREEGMLVVPEGGGDFEANMTMLLDGHSTVEHSLSVAPIYRDVVQLFAQSEVGYTPTLLVSYGGQMGENWFYQHQEVWKNEKLQSFHPPRMIDARARRRTLTPEEDYNHKTVAEGAAQIIRQGGLVTVGAHGQLQGLGAHWEMWAMGHGGMTPMEALKVATLNGAIILGMEADLGSIEEGKLADIAILDQNPLEKIENSNSVTYTVMGGVLYEAESMDRLWPSAKSRGPFTFETKR